MINEQRDMTADDTQRHGDSLQRHQDRTQASGDTMQVAGDTMQVAEDHNRQRKKKVGSKNVADFKGKKSEVDGFLAYMRQLRALCESTMRLDDVMLNSLIEKLIAEIPPEKLRSLCREQMCSKQLEFMLTFLRGELEGDLLRPSECEDRVRKVFTLCVHIMTSLKSVYAITSCNTYASHTLEKLLGLLHLLLEALIACEMKTEVAQLEHCITEMTTEMLFGQENDLRQYFLNGVLHEKATFVLRHLICLCAGRDLKQVNDFLAGKIESLDASATSKGTEEPETRHVCTEALHVWVEAVKKIYIAEEDRLRPKDLMRLYSSPRAAPTVQVILVLIVQSKLLSKSDLKKVRRHIVGVELGSDDSEGLTQVLERLSFQSPAGSRTVEFLIRHILDIRGLTRLTEFFFAPRALELASSQTGHYVLQAVLNAPGTDENVLRIFIDAFTAMLNEKTETKKSSSKRRKIESNEETQAVTESHPASETQPATPSTACGDEDTPTYSQRDGEKKNIRRVLSDNRNILRGLLDGSYRVGGFELEVFDLIGRLLNVRTDDKTYWAKVLCWNSTAKSVSGPSAVDQTGCSIAQTALDIANKGKGDSKNGESKNGESRKGESRKGESKNIDSNNGESKVTVGELGRKLRNVLISHEKLDEFACDRCCSHLVQKLVETAGDGDGDETLSVLSKMTRKFVFNPYASYIVSSLLRSPARKNVISALKPLVAQIRTRNPALYHKHNLAKLCGVNEPTNSADRFQRH